MTNFLQKLGLGLKKTSNKLSGGIREVSGIAQAAKKAPGTEVV